MKMTPDGTTWWLVGQKSHIREVRRQAWLRAGGDRMGFLVASARVKRTLWCGFWSIDRCRRRTRRLVHRRPESLLLHLATSRDMSDGIVSKTSYLLEESIGHEN